MISTTRHATTPATGGPPSKRLHELPDGVLIDRDIPLHEALAENRHPSVADPRTPLFEATFSAHQVLVRADMIRQTDGGRILTEIKSSTRVKPYT